LRGEQSSDMDLETSCSEIIRNRDLKLSSDGRISNSINGMPLDDDDYAQPCGLIARYFFNDSY
jgi:hypothetical protein